MHIAFGYCRDRRTLGKKLAEVSFRASEPRLRLGTFDDYVFPARGIGEGLEAGAFMFIAGSLGYPKAGFEVGTASYIVTAGAQRRTVL
jgi:hypothetical protein